MPTAAIRPYNGTPTLFLNDEPNFGGHQWLSNHPGPDGFPAADAVRAFGENGVHISAMGVNGIPQPDENGRFDFSTLDFEMRGILKEDPEALYHLRIYFETGEWWNKKNAEECELGSDGVRLNQSYASSIWRDNVRDFLQQLVSHLKESGFYDRVVAYQVQAGICGEWIKNVTSMQPICGDFSEPMRRHFRHWLKQRYQNDTALQKAWANASVTLSSAEVPSADQQLNTTHRLFRNPSLEQNVIDYYTCLARLVADDLIEFCQIVKDLTNGNALAGAFYGYLMDLAWNDNFFGGDVSGEYSTVQRSGHLGLCHVLESPVVDYIVSPYGYAFRGIGGDGLPMPPTESLRIHNKLYILEEDSHLHNEMDPQGRNFNRKHTLAIYQREFTETITHGLGIWWFADWPAGSYSKQAVDFTPWLAKFRSLATWGMSLDRTPRSEVAVIMDDESFMYESLRNSINLPMIFRQRVTSLARFGAPHDVYLLNDLIDGRIPEYKMYIFLNTFHLNDARRMGLKKQIQRDGKTSVWLYGAGYLNTTPSLDNITDLTGIKLGKWDNPWGPFMHVTHYDHTITRNVAQDLFWGTTAPLAPLFHIEDPDVVELGQIVYSLGRCQPGLGVKSFRAGDQQWHSVYCATPDIPAPVLRGIAEFAGVHLYSHDGDVLHATPDLLGLHSLSGGKRDIKLAQTVEVIADLFNDKVIATNTDHFAVTLPPISTSLYFTGTRADLDKLDSNLI